MDKPVNNTIKGSFLWLPLVLFALALLPGCCNSPKSKEETKKEFVPNKEFNWNKLRKPVLIYKTRADYNNKVPVMLSEDKTTIVSFPSTGDIFYKGNLAIPIRLDDGYLLDNRGIRPNMGFLDMTYLEYSELPNTPTPAELNKIILDRDPFIEIWYCGSRDSLEAEIPELNELIGKGFPGCQRLK